MSLGTEPKGPYLRSRARLIAALGLFMAFASTSTSTQGDAFSALQLPATTHPGVLTLMENGTTREALHRLGQELQSNTTPALESLILRATLNQQAELSLNAERDWQEVIERAVFMRTFARRQLVTSLLNRGAPEQAENILNMLLRSDSVRHRDLLLDLANAYFETNALDRAVTTYRRVLASTSLGTMADSARLGLANTFKALNDTASALNILRETQLQHRTSTAFAEARSRSHRLAESRGEQLAPFDEVEYRELIRRLRNASHYIGALDLLEEWQTHYPNSVAADTRAMERITTLYAQRTNENAVEAAQQFYEAFPRSSLVGDVRLTDFRLAVRMGNIDRARRLGLDLWNNAATPSHRQDAALLLGAYLGAIGLNDEALSLYQGLFQSSTNPDVQRDMLWRAGIAALRDGQYERARINLSGLVSRQPTGDLDLAAQYWLAVAEEKNGDTITAARLHATLASRYPYHYYGITARARLDELAEFIEINIPKNSSIRFPDLTISDTSTQRAEYKAAMALARAGLIQDAAWYLRRLLDQNPSDRGLALLAARASAAGDQHASVTQILVNHFGTYLQRPAQGLPPDFWSLVYPRPFWKTVNNAAKEHGANPALLVSLMRRESRFDPEARSPVGAVGLLQIMPYTAEALAERAGVGYILTNGIDDAALKDPGVNIAISARLNADLLQLFEDEILPVIASYNAGEDRVEEWWAGTRHLRGDFFVDSIPYSETRRFAREVIANLAAYERVYATPN
ncbi:MAG: transglycosylase SLT domain-containing protein [Vicinamibacterales bacterium]